MNKVLLSTLNAKYIHVNLAIRLLYQLNKTREGLSWNEFTIKESPEDIARYCEAYDLVAFSCYIWNIKQTLNAARKIKEWYPHIKILLGGPEVSYDWKEVINREEIDFIIVGEGEIPFQRFLAEYPAIENIPNLVFKQEREIKFTPKQETFQLNLLENINPYIQEGREELYNRVLYLETSRGCPYKCEFCLASLDNKVRYLPMQTIQSTLLHLMQHGKTIKFLDRTFNIKKDFTLEVFQFILQHHVPGNVFQFEITADILHPDIIQFIQEKIPLGLFRFEIGIQTVNQKANLEVSRKQNFDKTKQIILSLKDKVEMHLDLIVGLPFDYWEDIKYSFEEVFKLFPPELQLGFLKFLKGTPVRYKHEQHGYVFDEEPPYQIISSNYLSEAELNKISLLEHMLEIYWNKKRAVHSLKYVCTNYSIFDFLMDLGIYFKERLDLHRYNIIEIFETLNSFAELKFPKDEILKQLIAIDYYSHHKISPKPLFIEETDKKIKYQIIAEQKLNHHKFRHIILPINFNFHLFSTKNLVHEEKQVLIFQYNGTTQAQLLLAN